MESAEQRRPVLNDGQAAKGLTELARGQGAWFAASEQGPSHHPALVVIDQTADPRAQRFASQVASLQAHATDDPPICGVLRRLQSGKLVFTSREDSTRTMTLLSALATHTLLSEHLAGATVLSMESTSFTSGTSVSPPDLSRLADVLQKLNSERIGLFWFTDVAADHTPTLIVESSAERLKAAAKQAKGSGQVDTGQIRTRDDGRLAFHTRTPVPDFLGHLARYVALYGGGYPQLDRLRNAVIILRDESGNVLRTLEDERAWARISPPSS